MPEKIPFWLCSFNRSRIRFLLPVLGVLLQLLPYTGWDARSIVYLLLIRRVLRIYVFFIITYIICSRSFFVSSPALYWNTMANKRMNESWCRISFSTYVNDTPGSGFVFGLSPGLHVPHIIHWTFLHYLVANTEQWTTKSTYSRTYTSSYIVHEGWGYLLWFGSISRPENYLSLSVRAIRSLFNDL